MRYRKKPVEVKALEWTGSNLFDVTTFLEGVKPLLDCDSAMAAWEAYKDVVTTEGLQIITLEEGVMKADIGDFIIEGVKGEHYPCKPDIFHLLTYEEQDK